jgi:PTS system nitrogen regulatory IIA component
MKNAEKATSLASLLERGGIYRNILGNRPQEILSGITAALPDFPEINKDKLLQAVLEREDLMSTGIGKGIALPHPRQPMLAEGEEPFAAIAFPALPLDWQAQDGLKVHTVILIVSASTKQHLDALSRINFLCQQKKFYSLIENKVSREEIIAAVKEAESAWK